MKGVFKAGDRIRITRDIDVALEGAVGTVKKDTLDGEDYIVTFDDTSLLLNCVTKQPAERDAGLDWFVCMEDMELVLS